METAKPVDNTYYVCQHYGFRQGGKGRGAARVLERLGAVQCASAAEAKERARKMMSRPSCAGADAFAVTVDEDLGEYGDPAFLVRLGEVPSIDA